MSPVSSIAMSRSPSAGSRRSMAERFLYRIREVDGQDEEIAEILAELHRLTFFRCAPVPSFDWGHWWLIYQEATPVGFAGVLPSTHVRNAGYIIRVGVLTAHRGRRLQLRLMRVVESRARRNGWHCLVSDTTANIRSANNFIRAGYRLYQPHCPWAFADTLYWRKIIRPASSLHGTHTKRPQPFSSDRPTV